MRMQLLFTAWPKERLMGMSVRLPQRITPGGCPRLSVNNGWLEWVTLALARCRCGRVGYVRLAVVALRRRGSLNLLGPRRPLPAEHLPRLGNTRVYERLARLAVHVGGSEVRIQREARTSDSTASSRSSADFSANSRESWRIMSIDMPSAQLKASGRNLLVLFVETLSPSGSRLRHRIRWCEDEPDVTTEDCAL